MNPIESAVSDIGGITSFTKRLNALIARPVTYQAVRKWVAKGRLPRTEWTGETNYAAAIEEITDGRVTRAQLLDFNSAVQSSDVQPESLHER